MVRNKRAMIVAIVVGALLALTALVVFVVVPRVVAAKIEAAASRRALTIQYQSAAYRFTRAEVVDATITPQGSKRVVLRAKTLEAKIQGLSPYAVVIPQLDATISGPLDEVQKALEPVRKADEALPAAERLPVDVVAGSVTWTSPLGAGSSFVFKDLKVALRPAESLASVSLGKGKLTVGGVSFDGVSVKIDRRTSSGERIDLRASLGEDATIEASKKNGALLLDVDVAKFALDQAPSAVQGVDLSSAILDATLHAERDADGAVKSNGKVQLTKVKLPPVKAGPISLGFGTTVKVTWKGSPKKGKPGTMLLDDAKVEITLGGRARVVKVSGEVGIGDDGTGPFEVKLDWDAGPFACSEFAADATSGIVKGIAGNAIGGTVKAHGSLKGDVADPASLKKTLDITEACTLDVGKGLGGLINGLPF